MCQLVLELLHSTQPPSPHNVHGLTAVVLLEDGSVDPPVVLEVILRCFEFWFSSTPPPSPPLSWGGKVFVRSLFSSSLLALHSSGVLPWARGQPETAKCIAYRPVICPTPSQPDVGQRLPLLASTNVYGILFRFRGRWGDTEMAASAAMSGFESAIGLLTDGGLWGVSVSCDGSFSLRNFTGGREGLVSCSVSELIDWLSSSSSSSSVELSVEDGCCLFPRRLLLREPRRGRLRRFFGDGLLFEDCGWEWMD